MIELLKDSLPEMIGSIIATAIIGLVTWLFKVWKRPREKDNLSKVETSTSQDHQSTIQPIESKPISPISAGVKSAIITIPLTIIAPLLSIFIWPLLCCIVAPLFFIIGALGSNYLPPPRTSHQGGIAGMVAGCIGGTISGFFSIPIFILYLIGSVGMVDGYNLDPSGYVPSEVSILSLIILGILPVVMGAITGSAGGLIGGAFWGFVKRK